MAYIKKYDACAVIGTYAGDNGQKSQYAKIGVLTQWDNGGESLELFQFPGVKCNIFLQKDSQPTDQVAGTYDVCVAQRTFQGQDGQQKTYFAPVGKMVKFTNGGISLQMYLFPSTVIRFIEQKQQPQQQSAPYPQAPAPATGYAPQGPIDNVPF